MLIIIISKRREQIREANFIEIYMLHIELFFFHEPFDFDFNVDVQRCGRSLYYSTSTTDHDTTFHRSNRFLETISFLKLSFIESPWNSILEQTTTVSSKSSILCAQNSVIKRFITFTVWIVLLNKPMHKKRTLSSFEGGHLKRQAHLILLCFHFMRIVK